MTWRTVATIFALGAALALLSFVLPPEVSRWIAVIATTIVVAAAVVAYIVYRRLSRNPD